MAKAVLGSAPHRRGITVLLCVKADCRMSGGEEARLSNSRRRKLMPMSQCEV